MTSLVLWSDSNCRLADRFRRFPEGLPDSLGKIGQNPQRIVERVLPGNLSQLFTGYIIDIPYAAIWS